MQTYTLQLIDLELVCEDVYKLTLAAEEQVDYRAGQYLLVQMGEQDLRPFSIASSPSVSDQIELHIGANPANPYAWDVIQTLQTHGCITVQAGAGDAYWQPSDATQILIAGGTGYAYVKSILMEAIAQDASNPIYLYWGARTEDKLYELESLQDLAERHDNIHIVPVVEQAEATWTGHVGNVLEAVSADFSPFNKQQVLIAGPFPMAKAAREQFIAQGLSSDNLIGDAYAFI